MEKSYRCGCDLENVFNKLFIPSIQRNGECGHNRCK